MKRFVALMFAVCFGVVATPTTSNAAPIQLALILDESGSIGSTNFNSMKTGINSALNAYVPLNGSVELTVVKFGTNASVVIGPTLINSAAALASVTTAITNTPYNQGSTNTAAGINLAVSQVMGSIYWDPNNKQIFNIVTDGLPNVGSPDGETAALNAATAAQAAGIDELSAEGIALGTAGQNFLLNLVFPGNGYLAPPLTGPGFVYPVSDFDQAFADAFAQKIQFVISTNTTPEPMSMVVFGCGALLAGGLYRRNRKGQTV